MSTDEYFAAIESVSSESGNELTTDGTYRPHAHLNTDTPAGRLYEKLIKQDIAVYIVHTNLDVADGGINEGWRRWIDPFGESTHGEAEETGGVYPRIEP